MSASPIFIGGEGRSGTTLLAMILDSHPRLSVGPELHFRAPTNLGPYIVHCIDLFDQSDDVDAWFDLRHDRELYHGIHFVNRCRRFGIVPTVLRRLIEQSVDGRQSDLESFEDRCDLIERIGRQTCTEAGKARWGIKIMRDIRMADTYVAAWPQAQFIHIIRDGRDVAASQMSEHASWGYADAEQAAQQWVELIAKTRASNAGASGRLHELRYEDLVAQPRQTLSKLMVFLQEPWDDALLQHEQQDHALFTEPGNHPSIASVRKPIETSPIGRYRRDLQHEQIECYERIAGSLLIDLEYALSGDVANCARGCS